jgi:hypothetical protein
MNAYSVLAALKVGRVGYSERFRSFLFSLFSLPEVGTGLQRIWFHSLSCGHLAIAESFPPPVGFLLLGRFAVQQTEFLNKNLSRLQIKLEIQGA